MNRFATSLNIVLAVAALVMAACAVLQQRGGISRLSAIEQALGEQRQWNHASDEQRRQDHEWSNLLWRAQESTWVGSEDAPVECRLTVQADVIRASEPVRILVEVRNVSHQAQTVGGIMFEAYSLKLIHDGREAKYIGVQISHPPPPPVMLPPGRIMREMVTITPGQFAELSLPGLFVVEWTYTSGVFPPKVSWVGKLPAVRAEWQLK